MKIRVIIYAIFFSLISCGTTEKLSNQIKKEYLSKYSFYKKADGFRYRTHSLKQMLDIFHRTIGIRDTLIIIETYPDIQIPKSVVATIKSKSDSIYFYSDYDNNKLIKTYPQKEGGLIHDIFYDMVVDYMHKGQVSELKTLYKQNRTSNHRSTSYLTILKTTNKGFEIIEILIFERFGVSLKDSNDKNIRELINKI